MCYINNLKVEKGSKQNIMLPVMNYDLELPVCVIKGEEEGPVVLISAGVHGAEYIGIETAITISRELKPSDIKGTILFLLVANPTAAHSYTRHFVPEDGKNLNRMFPGKKDGTLSEKIAYTMEKELQSQADYYIDLHSGDTSERVMSFVYYAGVAKEGVSEQSRLMAEATGMSVRVKSTATTGSYNYAAIQGVPSILMERGGQGVFQPEELESYRQEVKGVLAHLGVLKKVPLPGNQAQKEILTATYIDSEAQGFWYPTKRPGDSFLEGELLGSVKDVWGNELQALYGEYDGIILYETVSMGVSEGESLIAYGK
jgi:predicted deacylase